MFKDNGKTLFRQCRLKAAILYHTAVHSFYCSSLVGETFKVMSSEIASQAILVPKCY